MFSKKTSSSSIPFILASSSPRRLALLKDIGITPSKVIAADIDETPEKAELPRDLAKRLSSEKLRAVMTKNPKAYVLAADTVVAVGRRILPKAENPKEVAECLRLMSGRKHHVYTGVALGTPEGKVLSRVVDSAVTFHALSAKDIAAYVESDEGIGKAGGYAIQGRAAAHIRFIAGSYSNIVGLPLFEVAQMLRGSGFEW
ncbi:MAG TPA: nucleoside triphosphate pyrophosphatase [Alphaproteobacteria bacterium]|nr:nucleoside triphosphate pyrophosphatase [Alphaproteobacteria bacterium]